MSQPEVTDDLKLAYLDPSFHRAIANCGVGLFEIDVDKSIVRFGQGFADLLKFERSTNGATIDDLVVRLHTDDQAKFRSVIEKCKSATCSVLENVRAVLPNGSMRWLRISGELSSHKQSTYLFVVRDTTDLVIANNQASKHSGLLESISQAAWR